MTLNKSTKINPVATGIVGVAAGMGAAAAMITLSKKENRKKAQKVLNDLKEKGKEFSKNITEGVEGVQKEIETAQEKGKRQVDDLKKEAHKQIDA